MSKLSVDVNEITARIDKVVHRTFQMDFHWDWPGGVAFYGIAEAFAATGKEEYMEAIKKWFDENLEDGLPPLSVNGVSMGHALLSLYETYKDEKYLETATEMAEYLKNDAPRFANGILQHTVNSKKDLFPQQAWVDTLMMAGLFLVRIGKLLHREDFFEDGLKQFHGHEEFLQDPVTNLYYHAWDHLHQTHMSAVYWARGNGWAALTMAQALDLIDVTHPSYMIIHDSLRDQLSALVRLQSESGLWHTVLDDPTSYLEVSGSAAIALGLLRNRPIYAKQVQKAKEAILSAIDETGRVTNVSSGTAVMPDKEAYKNVPYKRIQGWGQGLVLAFLAALLKSE